MESLRERLRELQRKLIKNERDVKEASREADVASSLAARAGQGATELDTAYQRALKALDEKATRSGDARERSARLQDKANRLSASVLAKVQELKGSSFQKFQFKFTSNLIIYLTFRNGRRVRGT